MVTDGQHLEMANIIKDETAAQAREHALSPTQYSKLEKRVVLKQDLTIVLLLCGCYFFAYLVMLSPRMLLFAAAPTDLLPGPRSHWQCARHGFSKGHAPVR